MRRSRVFHALRWACAAALAIGALAAPGSASADGGTETLGRARQAWDRGDFDTSEPLFKEALDQGGLSPKDTLSCYVHLGSARAVLNKKAGALVAFRQAALLDPRFAVPPEAGKKAATLANQARKEEAKIGPFQLRGDAPENVPARQPFRVTATVDATHAALLSRVGVSAHEALSDRTFEKSDAAATTVAFEVPATIATPNGTVTVRFDALDAHDNRLVSIERRVKVGPGAAEPAGVATGDAPAAKGDPNAWAKPTPAEQGGNTQPALKGDKSEGGGFWRSPWPYVLGSVALAAGGAAVYLGTRPADDVAVGAVAVRVR